MMAKSHVVVGLATWAALAPSLHVSMFDPCALGLVVAGSLLPDIDHPKSWVGQRTRPVSTALAAVFGHRGVTHSAIAVLGLLVLLVHAGYRRSGVAAIVVGYLSHLAADMLTPQGLRLAWPLRGTWSLPLCRTGSPAEFVVVVFFVAGVGWWLLHSGGGIAAPSRPFPR
jgi:inner membrane protein